jgi:flagellar motor switch protein FliG
MVDKTIVLTMFGKNDSVESISVSIFETTTVNIYNPVKNNAKNYCENINGLELKNDKWVYASIVEENEKIILKKPFDINITNFDIINDLDDRCLQRIFREISPTNLAIALKGTNEKTKEKVFKNVSKRIVEVIKEEMEITNNAGNEYVMESRKKVIEIIKQLHRTGEIVLTGSINI